jgi:Leucine-rich repeat (LRR) protein
MPDAGHAQQLQERWRQGQAPDVWAFLAGAGDLPPAEVVPVLRVDQHQRWQRGDRVLVESYLERLPHFHTDDEALLDLLYGEVLLRQEFRDAPDVEEYVRRFPRLEPALRRQFAVHRALTADPSGALKSTSTSLHTGLLPAGDPGRTGSQVGQGIAPAGPDSEPPRLSGYAIQRVLGRGGMGVVYLAEDTNLGRPVAIKVIRPDLAARTEAVPRFLREARATAAIKSDHIVTVHQAGQQGGVPYQVMEYLQGLSLEEWLRRGKQLTTAQLLRLGRELAQGLAAAHAAGLVHRDIKPANVWLEAPTGRVKVLDFGLARLNDGKGTLTNPGTLVGTPAYMAPEQARALPVDARTDLFSLGVVLYRLSTGRLPFPGDDALAILSALALDSPPPPRELNPDVPAALSDLILRLLAKSPADRPATAQEVVAALRGIERERAAARPPATAPPASSAVAVPADPPACATTTIAGPVKPQPPRRPRPLLVAAGLLLVGAGILLYQVIIRITDPEGKTHETEVNPGDTIRIVPKQPNAGKPPPAADPDRRAAEMVLRFAVREKGVGIGTDKEEATPITRTEDLPVEPFKLRRVHLEASPGPLDEVAEAVSQCPTVGTVNLNGSTLTEKAVAALARLPALRELYLSGSNCSDAMVAHLRGHLTLETLVLSDTQVTDAAAAHAATCPNLQTLWLPASITDEGFRELTRLKNLRRLAIRHSQVSDGGFALIRSFPDLNELRMHDIPVTAAGLVPLQGLAKLRTLTLSAPQVNIAILKKLPALAHLTVHGTPGDQPLRQLDELASLITLRISNAAITKESLEGMARRDRLELLTLDDCALGDEFLEPVGRMHSLKQLGLAGTPITDTGLGHLHGLKNLTALNVTKTGVTAAGVAKLRVALPQCRIAADHGTFGPGKPAAETPKPPSTP